jgi:site-specific recombinase
MSDPQGLSDAELDALLADLEKTPADFGNDLRKRAAAALRQVRHERGELRQENERLRTADPSLYKLMHERDEWHAATNENCRLIGRIEQERDEVRAANAALREALQEVKMRAEAANATVNAPSQRERVGVYLEPERVERILRALASSAPETP